MSIIFDESELQPRVNFSTIVSSDELRQAYKTKNDLDLTSEEKVLVDLFRKLSADQKSQILSQMQNLPESGEPEKKINLLKAIEESTHTVANEKLSDIIRDILR